jgi:hypothetical protein
MSILTLKIPAIDIKSIESMKGNAASPAPNTDYYGRIIMLQTFADSDANIICFQQPPYDVSNPDFIYFYLRSASGILGQNVWIVLNTAFINNQDVWYQRILPDIFTM